LPLRFLAFGANIGYRIGAHRYRSRLKMAPFSFNGKPKAAAFFCLPKRAATKRSRLRLAVKRAIAIREKYSGLATKTWHEENLR